MCNTKMCYLAAVYAFSRSLRSLYIRWLVILWAIFLLAVLAGLGILSVVDSWGDSHLAGVLDRVARVRSDVDTYLPTWLPNGYQPDLNQYKEHWTDFFLPFIDAQETHPIYFTYHWDEESCDLPESAVIEHRILLQKHGVIYTYSDIRIHDRMLRLIQWQIDGHKLHLVCSDAVRVKELLHTAASVRYIPD